MPKKFKNGPKLPGDDLEPTLKTALDNMKPEELRAKVSEVALYKQAREQLLKTDPAVVDAREALNRETKDYKDEIKGAQKQIAYISHLLESAGKL
jgi:hypothetical protein